MTTFAHAQPLYAEHGIATFPVTAAKRPAVNGYLRTGLRGSSALAARSGLGRAPALGFVTDRRNGITVLDIDVADEHVLSDALDRHGRTPLIARTGSGKFHAYYRFSNERRLIRPWAGREIDLLGAGGFVVAPPSSVIKGSYSFIEGTLDDVHRLPVLRNLELPTGPKQGARNRAAWEHCMRHAHHCDNEEAVIDVARTFNDICEPPMEDAEVMQIAQSAWRITERGDNRFGQRGAWFPQDEVNKLIDPDAFYLLAFLRSHQGPTATFMCTNSLADKFGWRRHRLVAARDTLIELDYFRCVSPSRQHVAAMYRWVPRMRQ